MKFFKPFSFFTLLVTGFTLTSLPLLAALLSSHHILDNIARQGGAAVFRSVERVSNGRQLAELARAQERQARLYQVIGEAESLAKVNTYHFEIEQVLNRLSLMEDDPELTERIQRFQAIENHLVAVLNRKPGEPEQRRSELEHILPLYADLNSLVNDIDTTSNDLMLMEVGNLKKQVDKAKNDMLWQTSGVIVFSILLIILFVVLIAKPIRQIDHAIELLGDGDFHTAIRVSGPSDLEMLGEKLDWLRQRLAQLDREKVKLIAHISHELKTPLASIKEGSGLLRDELVGPINDRQKSVVDILYKNCNKLQKLIENIVEFNMAQARRGPTTKVFFSLKAAIEEIAAEYQNILTAHKIRLKMSLPELDIYGDKDQIKTVLDNLLSNAVKFTAKDGLIIISVHRGNNIVVIRVKDNGTGIPEKERAKIFAPFFQGKSSEQLVVKGSGLGLAIAREYVRNHGGTIRLLPAREGAHFEIKLPVHLS